MLFVILIENVKNRCHSLKIYINMIENKNWYMNEMRKHKVMKSQLPPFL